METQIPIVIMKIRLSIREVCGVVKPNKILFSASVMIAVHLTTSFMSARSILSTLSLQKATDIKFNHVSHESMFCFFS